MAIKQYEKDGETFWMVYINIRSKDSPDLRVQKRVLGLKSKEAAIAEEKKLLRDLTQKLVQKSMRGHTWDYVIGRWELAMRADGNHFPYSQITIKDYVSSLCRWTKPWLKKSVNQLNKADGREMLAEMDREGKSRSYRKNVKYMVNVVFKWGIEERLITGGNSTPVEGLKLTHETHEKIPDILTIEEIRRLLQEARNLDHPWYAIWATALLTGMRSGEMHALLWSDVDLANRKITVSKSYNNRLNIVKSTKAGYWRTVPISDELFSLLSELKVTTGSNAHVLPRFRDWTKGEQAKVLRIFCLGIGIRSVCFHSLRACFATQLLAHDIAPARVMKICGWRDLKTMQRYVRLAGIDEKGATQVLKVLPSDAAVMAEVVNLFAFKNERK